MNFEQQNSKMNNMSSNIIITSSQDHVPYFYVSTSWMVFETLMYT